MTKLTPLLLFIICSASACISTVKIPAKYKNVQTPYSDYYVNRAGDTIFEKSEVRSRIMTADKISGISRKYSGNGDIHIAATEDGYFKRVRKGYNEPEATSNNWAILRIAGKIAVYEGVTLGWTGKRYGSGSAGIDNMPTASRNLFLQKNDTSSFVDFNVTNLTEMISDDAEAMSYINKMQNTKSKYSGLMWGGVGTLLAGIVVNIFWVKDRIECGSYSKPSSNCPPIFKKFIFVGTPLMILGTGGILGKVSKENAKNSHIYKAIRAYNSK